MSKSYQDFYDSSAGLALLSYIINNPSILDDNQYSLNADDFYTEIHKLLFRLILAAKQGGARVIDLPTIENILYGLGAERATWNSFNGNQLFVQLKAQPDIENFDYYYTRVKKDSLVRAMAQNGMDMSWLVPSETMIDAELKTRMERNYSELSLKNLSEIIEQHFLYVRDSFLDNQSQVSTTYYISDGYDELFEKLQKEPEMGLPLYGKYVNTITRGARLGKFYLRSAASGVGKALPNDTKIPTPDGWKTVGDIIEGDYLFDRQGRLTKVLKVFPQSKKLRVWKVILKDGREIECCKDHLWTYWYQTHRGWALRTETTQELLERASRTTGFQTSTGGYKYKLPINEAVQYPEKTLDIPPYSMGALLGDGSLRYNKTNKALTFSSETEEIPNRIAAELGLVAVKNNGHNYNYTFKETTTGRHNYWVEEIFKNYSELWNVKSEDKFIPKKYLQGSIEQRMDLFRGLMDTDGGIDKKGRLRFTTISPLLRDDFIELCHSLGFITSWGIDQRQKYSTGECYYIHIQAQKEIKPKLFYLQRKVKIATDYANSHKRENKQDSIPIVNIELTDRLTDMTCFLVDNDEHLFQVGDFIVTHNTRAMMADACMTAMSSYYDLKQEKWISTGSAEPVVFISTELGRDELQTMATAFIAGVNEDLLLGGALGFGEEARRVEKAKSIIKKSKLIIEELPNFTTASIERIIKSAYFKHHSKMVFFDYLGTSLGVLEEMKSRTGTNLREDSVLFLIATRLKELAVEYNMFIMTATQLNAAYKTDPIPDQSLLRGAKESALIYLILLISRGLL